MKLLLGRTTQTGRSSSSSSISLLSQSVTYMRVTSCLTVSLFHIIELYRSGIGAQAGGGEYWSGLTERSAKHLAERIQRNLEDWDLDGVDFYYMDSTPAAIWSGSHQDPGTSGAYALAVLMNLRRLVGNTKTITYSTSRFSASGYLYYTQMAIIATIHPYLDVINLDTYGALSQDQLADLELHNIPLSKIGLLTTRMTMDLIGPIVEQVIIDRP